MPDASERAVVVPPGRPIEEAAAWVGHACWVELRLHEVLTGWLAAAKDPERVAALWSARADAGERAEAWHRRLPLLREMPKESLVVPSSPGVVACFAEIEALADLYDDGGPAGAAARQQGALVAVMRALRLGYRAHQAVAVGPADAPVADTLADALRSTFDAADGDPDPAVVRSLDAAGGLP